MKPIELLASALLVTTLAAACSPASNSRTSSRTTSTDGTRVQVQSNSSFSDVTELREVVADVPEGATSNVLKLDVRALEQGTIVLRVFAPDGTKQLEKTLDMAERREHEFALETTTGKWRLEADLKDAQGSYVMSWVAAR